MIWVTSPPISYDIHISAYLHFGFETAKVHTFLAFLCNHDNYKHTVFLIKAKTLVQQSMEDRTSRKILLKLWFATEHAR